MYEFFLYAYVTAVGFAIAGLCASFTHWVTGTPLRFEFFPGSVAVAIPGVLARVVAGPAILMRNAIKGALKEGREPYWLALSTFIAALWSFFSGACLLELIIVLRA